MSLPPTYTQLPDTQLLIIPPNNATQFQNGFLGVEETASVDGQVHVKGAAPGDWNRLTVSLVTMERDEHAQVQISSHTVELFAAQDSSGPGTSSNLSSRPPTSSNFSIPLTNDTPQAVRTPISSLSHQIIAKLYPSSPDREPLVTTQDVEIRRYSPIESPVTQPIPHTYTLELPTPAEVQISRRTFRLGDIIPIYVTVPVPTSNSVLEDGLRLRNIKVELIRSVKVHQGPYPVNGGHSTSNYSDSSSSGEGVISESSLLSGDIPPRSPILVDKVFQPEEGVGSVPTTRSFTTVCTWSGASARFHSSRPLRIRLLLRALTLPSSPLQVAADTGSSSTSSDCSITQHTLLHSVEFSLNIIFSFLYQRQQPGSTSSSSTTTQEAANISIPVVLLPSPATTAPSFEELDMESAYHKKFDKPPVATNRDPNADIGPPGPSASGVPPPFDDRDVPPPPFSDPHQATSVTSRLPTFLESEAHYVVPQPGPSNVPQTPYAPYPTESMNDLSLVFEPHDSERESIIEGEGRLFGFRPEDQFDGLESGFGGSAEPPPSIESVQADTDLTALAELVDQPERALEVIGRGMAVGGYVSGEDGNLENALDMHLGEDQPPAPPFTDDPADPPPGIDMEYRTSPFPSHLASDSQLPPPPISPIDPPPSIEDILEPRGVDVGSASQHHSLTGARPPPYLTVPEAVHADGHHGPPPYVDLRPSHTPPTM